MTAPHDARTPAWRWMELLDGRQISAVELLALYEEQVDKSNPKLNAIVLQDFERARAQAKAADLARSLGETGALLGLPHTVKDCIYVAGFPTTGGLPERRAADLALDSPLSMRLRRAGSVVFGKTNVPPYAADWQSDNPLFGRTLNPWSDAVTPGGSSGGAASALAAGMTPLEFGGDLAGSIRIPASFCGVFGHKSTEALLPRAGHFPGQPQLENVAVGMGVQGPMGRCARDLALALDVMENAPKRLGASGAVGKRLSDYRVAVLQLPAWLPVSDEVRDRFDSFCRSLGSCGVNVQVEPAPALGDLREFMATYRNLLSAIAHAAMPPPMREASAKQILEFGAADQFAAAAAAGARASAGEFIGWSGMRAAHAARFGRMFENWDVLLTPTQITVAFEHDRSQPDFARRLRVNGRDEAYAQMFVLPSLCNLTGHPATAFPIGLGRQSALPVGAQAIGPLFGDRSTLGFVDALEKEAGVVELVPPGYQLASG